MSLADYVAKKYLNLDTSPERIDRKRKRKGGVTLGTGIHVVDDDPDGMSTDLDETVSESNPQTVNTNSSEFRKTKKNNWTFVGASISSNTDQAAADAIISSTVAEKASQNTAEENKPQVVEDVREKTMESGAYAGLQSAAQVNDALERRKRAELRQFQIEGAKSTGKGQETIYRDASGRIINISMKRAEARRKAQEEEWKKQKEVEEGQGDVQRAEKVARQQALTNAKYMNVARYADDTDLNEELKEKERWNDPAAQFLAQRKETQSVSGKPLYQGSSSPNRYGIKPGYRWDGVDRSTGFEKEYFAARNRRQNTKDLQYQWQYDV